MKGDKVVNILEAGTYPSLFFITWKEKVNLFQVCVMKMYN